MKDKRPSFQFYPKDFISDENVICMTLEERGAYITLLCYCWMEGSIPADGKRIAMLLGCQVDAISKYEFANVLSCFMAMPSNPNRLIHGRLEKERQKQDDFRDKKSQAGKKGAEKRWVKPDNGNAIVLPLAKNALSSSSTTSSTSSTSLEPKTLKACALNFETDWKSYPRTAGNKKKAQACYLKSVTTPEKRKEFLAKMKTYIASVEDPQFLKHGETFFRNWQDIEIDSKGPVRGSNNGASSKMAQAIQGRGEFVDLVLEMIATLLNKSASLTKQEAADQMLRETGPDDKQATARILYAFGYSEMEVAK